MIRRTQNSATVTVRRKLNQDTALDLRTLNGNNSKLIDEFQPVKIYLIARLWISLLFISISVRLTYN